jgi:predicted outer membrane repeat protein
MDADTDPEIDVEGVEITIAGVLWDATSEADVAGAGDVVIDGMNTFDEEGAAVGGYSPFEFNNADVYIGYLTIRDAFDDVAGAAIHFEQDDPEFIYELNLDHVVIDGAWINGGNGAGVYAEGSVTITDSTFTDNRADGGNGGAIYASAGVELATLTISNSQFYDSSASGSGGAIYTPAEIVFFESLTIESNKFQRNTAGSQGGAIRVSRGTSGTSITRNTFTENSAEQGGAVSINDGEDDSYLWSISRNTFAKNRATLNGGALHMALDNSGNVVAPNVKRNGFKRNSAPAAGAVVVESDYGTGRAILRRYERGLRGNSFQANRATSERRSANIGVHFD